MIKNTIHIIFIILSLIFFENKYCSAYVPTNLNYRTGLTVHITGSLSSPQYIDCCSNPFGKDESSSKKPAYKPFLKMIIFQNSINLINHITTISGQNNNLTKLVISNLYIPGIIFSISLHKTFLSLGSFSIPFENQKLIIQKSIIKC
jgi:hypothetical protein